MPDISGSADSVEYILYVVSGEKNSRRAVNEVSWGPGDLSADGLIKYQDLREIKRVFGSIPSWITKVPWLVNTRTRMHWSGSACFEKLSEIKEAFAAEQQRFVDNPIELGFGSHVRPDLTAMPAVASAAEHMRSPSQHANESQSGYNDIITLPPDPRDAFTSLSKDMVSNDKVTDARQHVQFARDVELDPPKVSKRQAFASGKSFIERDEEKIESDKEAAAALAFTEREEERLNADRPILHSDMLLPADAVVVRPARFDSSNVIHFDNFSEPPTPMASS